MTPKLSICMVTFNHEKYIREALESIFNQKVNFMYELVIGEDCSDDKTREITLEFKRKYPKIIRIFENKKNIGPAKNFMQVLNVCHGKYIAILDGDDMWTDSGKLQKQVDFLDNHPDYSISSHNVLVVNDNDPNSKVEWPGKKHKKVMQLSDILSSGSGGATSSLVYRNDLFPEYPKWYIVSPGDWALQVLLTSFGKMYYFSETMGIYRKHSGAATDMKGGSEKELAAFLGGGVDWCNLFNKLFDYKYDKYVKDNLVKYMYPNLVRIYCKRNEFILAKKYAMLILRGINFRRRIPVSKLIEYILLVATNN